MIDCDVLQADGGTSHGRHHRRLCRPGAMRGLHEEGRHGHRAVIREHVAAVSCGISKGVAVLDLDYDEDSTAETDANFVPTASGGLVEIQGTAEGAPFSEEQLVELLRLARKGIGELVTLQKQALAR